MDDARTYATAGEMRSELEVKLWSDAQVLAVGLMVAGHLLGLGPDDPRVDNVVPLVRSAMALMRRVGAEVIAEAGGKLT
jgi:hypothetical protein